MAIVSGLPNQQSSILSLRRPYEFRNLSSLTLDRPLEHSCRLPSDPVYARGVTRIQANAAGQMTGEVDPRLVEASENVSGGVSDGIDEAVGRGASAGRAADMPGRVAGTLRGVGRFAGFASGALQLWSGQQRIEAAWRNPSLDDSQRDAAVGNAVLGTGGALLGGAAGAAMGAALGGKIGAAIGTCFCPLVGTFVGGVLGCALGGVIGGYFGGEHGQRGAEALGRHTGFNSTAGDFVNDRFDQ